MSQSPIAFRETILQAAVGERKYIRYFEGRGHFAHLKVQLLPRPGELCALTRVPTLEIPEECYHAARAAIVRRLESGPIRHLPMHGLEVQFLAGTFMPRYSYPEAFALAAQMAFDDALARGSNDRRTMGSIAASRATGCVGGGF
jgi:translation elongation factor EF-G